MNYERTYKRWLAWAEVPRALYAMATLPGGWVNMSSAPKGDRRPIFVIPGIGMTDRSTLVIRQYLTFLGYSVHPWALGRNLGAKTIGIHNERLIERIEQVYRDQQQPLTLIGWSMGGIMARMVARRSPKMVREVICLGSPFGGDPFASSAWEVYERLSGHSLRDPVAQAQIAESKLPLPVPACSFYSRSDGIVPWQACREPNTPDARNIAVRSAHCGFGFSPPVLRAVADRLAATHKVPTAAGRHHRNRGAVSDKSLRIATAATPPSPIA
ncbi:MAG: alpha/beta hydrolase [Pseudomonadota bacterium]